MAITAANAAYRTQGPTQSGQVLADNSASSTEVALAFTAQVTLDGSTTSFTVNYIDGTATLPFTPSGILATVVGGTQPAAAPVSINTVVSGATAFTVYLSGAGSSANTLKIAGFILK